MAESRRIYEIHEVKERGIHTETLGKGHLKFIRKLGITHYDAWPYHGLTVEDVREELPEIFFTWNIETAKDLYADTPQVIREKYVRAVEAGAPGMVLDVCARKVPGENIQAFIDVAREFEDG